MIKDVKRAMETAFLHNSIINIEAIRYDLEVQGLSRKDILRQLELNYRIFSKKSAFLCVCCHKPVSMNLTKEEGRPFFFRHTDDSDCVYSDNSTTYNNHSNSHERKQLKDIGLTVFKEILQAQLKPHGIQVERGYSYKKKLSFVPDLTVTFPDSNIVWAIDYFTAVAQKVANGSYANHLARRMESYDQNGFVPFSFIDISWLALHKETSVGTLLKSEHHIARKTSADLEWDDFLSSKITEDMWTTIRSLYPSFASPVNIKNITYVDISNRNCKLLRFHEMVHNERNIDFFKVAEIDLPLDQALTLNTKKNNFMICEQPEDSHQELFLKDMKIRIAEHNKYLHERKQDIKLKSLQKPTSFNKSFNAAPVFSDNQLSDEEIDLQMKKRAEVASKRPVSIHPDNPKQFRGTSYSTGYNKVSPAKPSKIYSDDRLLKEIKSDKKEKLKEKLLNHPLTGDGYINAKKEEWRLLVLIWIKNNMDEKSIEVSLDKLIEYLKENKISFNQTNKIVYHPLKDFILFYQKEMRNHDLKTVEITFT